MFGIYNLVKRNSISVSTNIETIMNIFKLFFLIFDDVNGIICLVY